MLRPTASIIENALSNAHGAVAHFASRIFSQEDRKIGRASKAELGRRSASALASPHTVSFRATRAPHHRCAPKLPIFLRKNLGPESILYSINRSQHHDRITNCDLLAAVHVRMALVAAEHDDVAFLHGERCS